MTAAVPVEDGATAVPAAPASRRSPCPCGSGKRWKACHGSARASAAAPVARPFAGLAGEADWVALREVVPAATAPLRLRPDGPAGVHADRDVLVCTVLPRGWPALVRRDGTVLLGLQVRARSGDASRDLAAVLLAALGAGPGPVAVAGLPGDGPRLQDLLHDEPLPVRVHDGYEFWLGDGEQDPEVSAQLAATEVSVPTRRLPLPPDDGGAYWCRMPERAHLRWALPEDEPTALDALARLAADGALALRDGEGAVLGRWVGSFRAAGLLVPVWDLPGGTRADDVVAPARAWRARVHAALGAPGPLPEAARRARPGLASRQLTLR